jgi:iron only hydrogenase large subunit-like protein
MNNNYPIYTITAECQDCYKCVRHCPVKAIRVEGGRAGVIAELCIGCGSCVAVCPVHAKQVRDDLAEAEAILRDTAPVYVSLAPSWVSEFAGVSAEQMIAGLRELGFAGVSETALGAQVVSEEIAAMMRSDHTGFTLSSACPAVVDYLCRYQPELAAAITGLLSPALTHCKMLRECFGDAIRVIFIGPCVAKKNESDRHPELMNLALTFTELKRWFNREKIILRDIPAGDNYFVPRHAEEGALYPVEGGMIETIKARHVPEQVKFITLAGIDNIKAELTGIKIDEITEAVFIEMLACRGGCIHGPCTELSISPLLARLMVMNEAAIPHNPRHNELKASIFEEFPAAPVITADIGMYELTQALKSIGKSTPEDELNCGGCGYETCRNFAAALLNKKAETSMCVSYLRKQTQKKANALLRSIPSGVVIFDQNLKVVECNRRFAEIFGEPAVLAFEASPGMSGADIKRIVPFYNYFAAGLTCGGDIKLEAVHYEERVLGVTIFNIEAETIAGAIITDITGAELRREEIAERASEIISKNLAAVQDIACKLGENMAETEILLRSIGENFSNNHNIRNKGMFGYE